jgi:lipoprotein-releasing system permease protein
MNKAAGRGSAGIFGAAERMIAFRYLRARREEGFVSVIALFALLGILLGVGTLIVVMAVFDGFGAEFLTQVLAFQGDLSVLPRDAGLLPGFDATAAAIRQVPGVVRATPILDEQALVLAGNAWSGVRIRAMRADDLKDSPDIAGHVVAGALDGLDDGSIVLGYQNAQILGVKIGDRVGLVSMQNAPSETGALPPRKSFRVAAMFDTGFGQFDKGFGFISLGAAQAFFAAPDRVTSIQVFVDDPQNVGRYRGPIAQAAGDRIQLFDWQNRVSPELELVRTQRSVVSLILVLIIVVAAFNVISSMIMLVRSKTRDIAILRSMGATRHMILRIFFLTGASIGIAGTVLGVVAGVVFATHIESIRRLLELMTGISLFPQDVYFFSRMPAQVDAGEVLSVVATAFALSFLATLYPAWRAARLEPVEALRHD